MCSTGYHVHLCCHGNPFLQPLTQPAYSLRIDAFYLYQNQTRTSATISIVVSGIKTAPSLVPSFGVSSFTQSISEASPIGTLLYPSLYAVANTSISYSLGGCISSFTVDATTGGWVGGYMYMFWWDCVCMYVCVAYLLDIMEISQMI